MRSLAPAFAALLLLAGCSDAVVPTGNEVVIDRHSESWVILHQQSVDGTQDRIIAHELSLERGEDVVLYGPEPADALVLCPNAQPSVLRGSPGAGYVMNSFFDDGEAFGFRPTSLGPNRVTYCPIWSYAAQLGVAFTAEVPVAWGSERTLVLDPRGDALGVVPLELPNERANASSRIDEHRYAVSAHDAQGSVLRIVDIDNPEATSVVHRQESLDRGGYGFNHLEHWLVYATPSEPRELRAYDVDQGSDAHLATLRGSIVGLQMVHVEGALVVSEHVGQAPVQDVLVVRDRDDDLVVTPLDLSAIPAQPLGLSTAAGELIYRFESGEQHGYAMLDPDTTDGPRVVAQYDLDEWLLGPTVIESLGLAGGTMMREDVPSRLVWFALDGSTPEMNPIDLDISECDSSPPAIPAVVTTDQEATFWFFCDRDGVQHTAQWSPSVPEQRPQWEANGRRVETTEGPVVLRGTLELSDKLLGFDVGDPEGVQLLIDLPSGRIRPLTWEGWTTSARFFPELAP